MTSERSTGRGIAEGVSVYTASGDHLGTVKEVRGRYFKVDAPMQRDYWLPMDAVGDSSTTGEVRLSFDKDRLGEYTVASPDGDTATATPAANTHVETRTGAGIDRGYLHTPAGGGGTELGRTTEHELELKEEQLRAATQRETAGEVRLHTQVVEQPETLAVPVREEVLVIEHVAGTGKVLVGDRELPAGETVELTLYRERATASKEMVVTEDVSVRTMEVQHTEQLQGTIRKEHLVVDDPQGRVVPEGGAGARTGSEDEHGSRRPGRRGGRGE